eukprot:357281-Rhodomonas_salina.3
MTACVWTTLAICSTIAITSSSCECHGSVPRLDSACLAGDSAGRYAAPPFRNESSLGPVAVERRVMSPEARPAASS